MIEITDKGKLVLLCFNYLKEDNPDIDGDELVIPLGNFVSSIVYLGMARDKSYTEFMKMIKKPLTLMIDFKGQFYQPGGIWEWGAIQKRYGDSAVYAVNKNELDSFKQY